MSGKIFVWLLATVLLTIVSSAEAQQPKKVPRVGVLRQSSAHVLWTQLEAFRQGLRDLGYVERKNIAIEYRYAEGELDRLPGLADELARMKVDVIVVSSTPAVLAARNATKEIPIVFHTIGDPVASGVVASLARPGGNITGLTMGGAELYGKRLELLKETIPKLSRAAILWNPTRTGIKQNVDETQTAARVLKLQVQSLKIRNPEDIDPAFESAIRSKTGAILITQSPPITTYPKRIIDVAAKQRLPVMYPQGQWPDMGGLMSYGANVDDSYRYLASYVDKILKGSKPAELPVERSKKLELVINLKTAKQIGLTIPPHVLARADKVIK
ncbi:MAG TPA: ABC transporter substrate-binding protein [Pyrinomonadaceae bacterium]|jgi:putative ABC transport system substrate-binding protein